MAHQQARGGARARNGHAHLQATIGGCAPKLAGNGARITEQTRQPVQVERDLARTAHVDARRELARDFDQLRGITACRRVQNAVHRDPRRVYRPASTYADADNATSPSTRRRGDTTRILISVP